MALLLLMRLLHILLGIFWVGTMMFNSLFLFPAFRDAGPDGAKVGAALVNRRFMVVMPIVALVTILSGLWLYWHLSVGFQPVFMRSGMGMTLGIGAACAIAAFIVGIVVVRPAMVQATALAQSAPQAGPAERDAQLARAQVLRVRADVAGRLVTSLLVLAAAAMAAARYVG